jgi:hypothetical protein
MMDGAVKRDTAVAILFGAAFLLVLLNLVAALLFATSGMAFLWMVKTAMGLTGAFAIVGAGFGLMRARRHGWSAARETA